MGRNGVGKSLLARLLAGHLQPSSGSVRGRRGGGGRGRRHPPPPAPPPRAPPPPGPGPSPGVR
ncbi:ATP-binding cassette domain-containing protein [Pseudomonas aeruginosa]